LTNRGGKRERIRVLQPGIERGFACLVSGLSVNFAARNLWESAPVSPLLDCLYRIIEQLLMIRKEGGRHKDYVGWLIMSTKNIH
jgi:hypothetical protein